MRTFASKWFGIVVVFACLALAPSGRGSSSIGDPADATTEAVTRVRAQAGWLNFPPRSHIFASFGVVRPQRPLTMWILDPAGHPLQLGNFLEELPESLVVDVGVFDKPPNLLLWHELGRTKEHPAPTVADSTESAAYTIQPDPRGGFRVALFDHSLPIEGREPILRMWVYSVPVTPTEPATPVALGVETSSPIVSSSGSASSGAHSNATRQDLKSHAAADIPQSAGTPKTLQTPARPANGIQPSHPDPSTRHIVLAAVSFTTSVALLFYVFWYSGGRILESAPSELGQAPVLVREGRLEEALDELEKLLSSAASAPIETQARALKAMVLIRLDELDLAQEVIETTDLALVPSQIIAILSDELRSASQPMLRTAVNQSHPVDDVGSLTENATFKVSRRDTLASPSKPTNGASDRRGRLEIIRQECEPESGFAEKKISGPTAKLEPDLVTTLSSSPTIDTTESTIGITTHPGGSSGPAPAFGKATPHLRMMSELTAPPRPQSPATGNPEARVPPSLEGSVVTLPVPAGDLMRTLGREAAMVPPLSGWFAQWSREPTDAPIQGQAAPPMELSSLTRLNRRHPDWAQGAQIEFSDNLTAVYSSRDAERERRVTTWMLCPTLSASPEIPEEFLRIGRQFSDLVHPGLLRIYDTVARPHPCMVAEPFDGRPLAESPKRTRIQALREGIRIGTQITRALDFCHQRGFVHQDITPHNILISGSEVRLGPPILSSIPPRELEKLLGQTPYRSRFIPPEVARGETPDYASDIFQIGMVLHEIVTGFIPTHESLPGCESFVPVCERAPGTPPELEHLIHRCLDPNPRRRYQDVGLLAPILEDLAREQVTPVAVGRSVLRDLKALEESPVKRMLEKIQELILGETADPRDQRVQTKMGHLGLWEPGGWLREWGPVLATIQVEPADLFGPGIHDLVHQAIHVTELLAGHEVYRSDASRSLTDGIYSTFLRVLECHVIALGHKIDEVLVNATLNTEKLFESLGDRIEVTVQTHSAHKAVCQMPHPERVQNQILDVLEAIALHATQSDATSIQIHAEPVEGHSLMMIVLRDDAPRDWTRSVTNLGTTRLGNPNPLSRTAVRQLVEGLGGRISFEALPSEAGHLTRITLPGKI